MMPTPQRNQAEEFSLVLGGPLYQLSLRSRLIKPPFGNLSWRIVVITGMAWFPLALLTLLNGTFSRGVHVPFLSDFEVHARLLFALPLMILAEVVVHARMRAITSQFVERHIVTDDLLPAFNNVISS